uniref:Methyltransf_21 domain-containing protein n=1 Tax=Angiostrongylus cantonensis TaxID=6313 RepID=A0A0K0DIF3_ANGCA
MRLSVAYGVLAVVLLGLIMFFIHAKSSHVPSEDVVARAAVIAAFTDWNQCTMAHLDSMRSAPEKIWNNFAAITTHCTSITRVSKIKLVPFESNDGIKHYILIFKQVTNPSVVVSLGIGTDIRVEEKLKELLPENSEFFGADPVIVPNAALFKKVGTFFPYAVSAQTGLQESKIRLNSGVYQILCVGHIDVLTFFLKIIKRNYIDHLILDNEGPEYEFLPMIAVNNMFLGNAIYICHMNVVFHDPGPEEGYAKFAKIMWDLLAAGRFGIIHNLSGGNQRMFIVNYEDRRCIKKYLEQFFK